MPDIQQLQYLTWTPGQWLARVREFNAYAMAAAYSSAPQDVSVTGNDDCVAVIYTSAFGPPFDQFAIMWQAGTLEVEFPVQMLADSNEASGSFVYALFDDSGIDWSLVETLWTDVITLVYTGIADTYTDGSIVSIVVTMRVSPNEMYAQLQAAITIANDFQSRTILDSLTVDNNNSFGTDIVLKHIGPVAPAPVIGEPTPGASNSVELTRIADALEDLTTQSVDVSINHGAQMYSVYGKTITDDVP